MDIPEWPACPRIHIYQGAVAGHGTHVCLDAGTTLQDILNVLN